MSMKWCSSVETVVVCVCVPWPVLLPNLVKLILQDGQARPLTPALVTRLTSRGAGACGVSSAPSGVSLTGPGWAPVTGSDTRWRGVDAVVPCPGVSHWQPGGVSECVPPRTMAVIRAGTPGWARGPYRYGIYIELTQTTSLRHSIQVWYHVKRKATSHLVTSLDQWRLWLTVDWLRSRLPGGRYWLARSLFARGAVHHGDPQPPSLTGTVSLMSGRFTLLSSCFSPANK